MAKSRQRPPHSWPKILLVVAIVALAGWWQLREQNQLDDAPVAAEAGENAERYDLADDEARGGHTLARHVGRTDAELRARLGREPGISAASTYDDQEGAERTVARTLAQHARRVSDWVARTGARPNLALRYRGDGEVLGRTLTRGANTPTPSTSAVVVLRWSREDDYYVLTSYPEDDR